ncbi:dual specificity protein phosphatase family protein [Rhizobium sp. MHM7A]|uniref:dual specificity protein phosphatase family protein n=1 Tax=Rhizobium sp. MHM7A TaxID=2583233 RepID=UPI001105AB8A|nr:dual specificity protein phosphatase family protein [Rhizobium sp. MHM7A]TLX16279.1 hypothetical protein FFR93_02825 [Rhizobium sp. MHM7A]
MLIIGSAQDEFIAVKSLKAARDGWIGFDGVITIEDANFADGLRIQSEKTRQMVFQFDDTDRIGGQAFAPELAQIRRILEIGRHYRGKRLLVHCFQGQSRSAGAALAILADRLGVGREKEAVDQLLQICPLAVCNRVVLQHADTLLSRNGAIMSAWQAYENTNDKAAGVRLLRGLADQAG